MGSSRMANVEDVAAWQLCCGCGACAYVSPDDIEMIDVLEYGRRPRFRTGRIAEAPSAAALQVCPGIDLTFDFDAETPGLIGELLPAWGPVLEIWEGHAADSEIRYEGASGGVATALSLYAIEHAGMHGALHIQGREDVPYLNQTVLSTTRQGLLAGAGSRYAPASPCDRLKMIETAPRPSVFVGKPCDVAAVCKVLPLRPRLAKKIGLTIAFFCAGTPAAVGTMKMFRKMGIDDPSTVRCVRYRGQGWPGSATVVFSHDGTLETRRLTYEQSWGEILQKYRQWRCYICPDHTGMFADIAVADAWHRPIDQGQPGLSVLMVRSERGRQIVHGAVNAGYVVLESRGPEVLPACRPGHTAVLGALWGRLTALRMMGVPAPHYGQVSLFRFWWGNLGFREKVKSLLGTVRRVFRKNLHRRQAVRPWPRPQNGDAMQETSNDSLHE